MLKILFLLVSFSVFILSNDYYTIWNHKKNIYNEVNILESQYSYTTNNIGEALGITLIETIFHADKFMNGFVQEKKKNTDFKYLYDFEKSIK